jgi:hypothetical protein
MVKFPKTGTESPSSIDVIFTSGSVSWGGVVVLTEGACPYEEATILDNSKVILTAMNNDISDVRLNPLVTSILVNIHYNWHQVGNYLVLIKKG